MNKTLFTLAFCFFAFLTVNASVVITDVSPDFIKLMNPGTSESDLLVIDFDHDSTEDYNFSYLLGSGPGGSDITCYGPHPNKIYTDGDAFFPNVIAIDSGAIIDNTLTWTTAGDLPALYTPSSSAFSDSGEKYIAVKFILGANTHYGWIHVKLTSSTSSSGTSFTLTIYRYAYETIPNTAIVAGSGIAVPPAPLPGFTASTRVTDTKTTVSFTDRSANAPTSWEWTVSPATVSFVSGTTPTSQHPKILFNVAGKYTISLKATNAFGSNTITQTDYITVYNTPKADFKASTVSTDTKTMVTFTDVSSNMPASWEWTFTPATVTFVPGSSKTAQHPTVRFNVAGKYTVKLKASNPAGDDSSVKINYITVADTTTAPTSIDNYGTTNTPVTIYPNPARKFFIIENPANTGTVTILDLNGRAEFVQQIKSGKTELDIAQLPKGCHILRIVTPDGIQNTKLIIE